MPQTPSTRWCPTPEQLMILEEMYRSGLRTPNASQIQQITAHLSFYGKIEGKNVFYWFQNHKARDRQKLRRQLGQHHHHHLFHGCYPSHEAVVSPTPQMHHHHHTPTPLNFIHQGSPQERGQGMNLLCKLETSNAPPPMKNTVYEYDWMMMTMMIESSSNAHQYQVCKPLKTLDLFPTKSTGLRDGCSTSNTKPSSCTTSIN